MDISKLKEAFAAQNAGEQDSGAQQPVVAEQNDGQNVVAQEEVSAVQDNTQVEQAAMPEVVEKKDDKVASKEDLRVKELEKAAERYEKELSVLREYIDKFTDPAALYSSEEAYKAEQLKKAHPEVAHVADKIVKGIDKMPLIEQLKLGIMLDIPDIEGGDEGALELIMEKYGIDDIQDIPRSIKNKMLLDAKAVRTKVDALRSSVPAYERPQTVQEVLKSREEYEQKLKQLSEAWEKAEIGLAEIQIKRKDTGDVFSFAVEEDYVKAIRPELIRLMTQMGLDPQTPEGRQLAEEELRVAYLVKNFDRIAEAYASHRVTKAIEEIRRRDVHMPNDLQKENPTSSKPDISIDHIKKLVQKFGR